MGIDRDDLIKNIKNNITDDNQLEKVEQIADSFKDKSDDEIFFEIIRINKEMESELSSEKYNEILEKLDSIRPLLSKTQSIKLDLVLKSLKKKD